jgi:hypothetical protein
MHKPALVAVVLLSTLAFAQDPLPEAAKQLAADCGSAIKLTFETPKVELPGRPPDQGPVYCREAVDGIRRACSDAVAKAGVAEVLKSVTCRMQAGASKQTKYGGPLLALEGGALTITYDWNTSNVDSDLQTWVMKGRPISGPNGPVTVEAKSARLEGEKQFGEAIEAFKKQCGEISVKYDFASEKGNAAKPAWQGYYYCRDVLRGLGSACESGGKKALAQKKFSAIECRFEKDASKRKDLDPEYQGAAHVLKGKTLGVLYDWTNGNLDTAASKWLRNLK